jgi:hypothetical protein
MSAYSKRDDVLKRLGYGSYEEYLASPLWISIRRRAFDKHGRRCVGCKRAATCIHHCSYDEKTLLGESLDRLLPLCGSCHERIEFSKHGRKRSLADANAELAVLINGRKPKHARKKKAKKRKLAVPKTADFAVVQKIRQEKKQARQDGFDWRRYRKGGSPSGIAARLFAEWKETRQKPKSDIEIADDAVFESRISDLPSATKTRLRAERLELRRAQSASI